MGVVKDSVEVVKDLAKVAPVYQDLLQPAAQEIGKGLGTVAKTVNVALGPIKAMVWGYDQIEQFISTRVAEKLRNVPAERIVTPEAHVVAPALIALRFVGHQDTLRELYANLLATSLDASTCSQAHPGFVDIIKNMSPDEARIMRFFASRTLLPVIDVRSTLGDQFITLRRNFSFIGKEAGCDHLSLIPSYLDNLERLGLIELPGQGVFGAPTLSAPNTYEPLETAPEILSLKERIEHDNEHKIGFARGFASLTSFGKLFCQACVMDRTPAND